MRKIKFRFLVLFFVDVLAITLATSPAADTSCNRECLGGFISKYLDAMLAHNPGLLPRSADLKFTEDSESMKLGEGLWKSVSAIRPPRRDVLDVRQGVAATKVVVEEAGSPVLLQVRLKILNKQITEVETMTVRNKKEGAFFSPDALKERRKEWSFVPERGQRVSREEMVKIAETYPAGLKVGSFVAVDVPFASGADRMENGAITAGAGCILTACENIKTQKNMQHPGLSYRVRAVDEEMGIVLMRLDFGETKSYGPGKTLVVWEEFKIYGGVIHAVEAFIRYMPSDKGSGWE
ncbi:MAG: hypothetical protein H6Q04_1866 [Acidobacteria bacterium]|nr:hypothetical protein [Acidobacteriota bacterium]